MIWYESKNIEWEGSFPLSTTHSNFWLFFTSRQIIIGSLSDDFDIVTLLAARELRRRPPTLYILNLDEDDLIFLTTFQPRITHVLNQKTVNMHIRSRILFL